MNEYIILTISMSAGLANNILNKCFAKKSTGRFQTSLLYNTCMAFLATLTLLVMGGFGACSWVTAILGVLFGAIIVVQGISTLKALEIGPMSYTTVIISFSTIITALSGCLFFGESIGIWQIFGIVFMLISFIFAVEKNADKKGVSFRWLIFCLIGFAGSGGVGLMQKIHQNTPYKAELNAFLVIAFTTVCISTGIWYVLLCGKEKQGLIPQKEDGKIHKALLILPACVGVFAAINHKLNLYLSGVMPSAVFFPIVNGGGLVLATLAALMVFKEKLTKRQWFGLIVGFISVLFLCIQ